MKEHLEQARKTFRQIFTMVRQLSNFSMASNFELNYSLMEKNRFKIECCNFVKNQVFKMFNLMKSSSGDEDVKSSSYYNVNYSVNDYLQDLWSEMAVSLKPSNLRKLKNYL